jgi:hypothetical protein
MAKEKAPETIAPAKKQRIIRVDSLADYEAKGWKKVKGVGRNEDAVLVEK